MESVFRTYKIPIILGAVSLLTIIVSLILLVQSVQPQAPIQFSQDAATSSAVLGITVDIEGAVVAPGVYKLPSGARIDDAILAAGGLSPEADGEYLAKTVNRAAKLIDGGKIYIPQKGLDPQKSQTTSSLTPSSGLISVNSATQSELETLPGIGPVTAKKIIDTRPYQTLEELVSKKAVGQAVFEKIKELISL